MESDIAGFITIGAVVAFVAAQLLRTLRTHITQKTLREAVKKGTAIDPELLMDADRPAPAGTNDLRIGMVLIALSLAIAAFGLLEGGSSIRESMEIALFPLFVGLALLLRLWLVRDRVEG